jgi:hypothetical protein
VDGDGIPDAIDMNVVRLGTPWFVSLGVVGIPQ